MHETSVQIGLRCHESIQTLDSRHFDRFLHVRDIEHVGICSNCELDIIKA